jgi:hypothetical protein
MCTVPGRHEMGEVTQHSLEIVVDRDSTTGDQAVGVGMSETVMHTTGSSWYW